MPWVTDIFRTKEGGRRKACRDSCQKYGNLGPGAVKTCEGMCNADQIDTAKVSIDDFACKYAGSPQTAYNVLGIKCPGFNPDVDSVQGAAYNKQVQAALDLQDSMNRGTVAASGNINLIIGIGAIAILAMLYFYYKATKKIATT